MKLAQLASTPQLVKLSIEDASIVEKYGEPVEFWVYDRHDIDTYLKLSQIEENDVSTIANIVKSLVVDEDGSPMLKENVHVPMDIMIQMINLVVTELGNTQSQTSAN